MKDKTRGDYLCVCAIFVIAFLCAFGVLVALR